MLKRIKRIVTKLLISCLDVNLFMQKIELERINLYKEKCLLGEASVLYYSSKIINYSEKEKIFIGKNTHIRGELLVYPYGGGISIGDFTYVGDGTVIRAAERITIGNNVLIAHNVNIFDTDSHEINWKEREEGFKTIIEKGHPLSKGHIKTAAVVIEDNVWISYNVSILKGVRIGKGAIVAAGSIVTKDVEPFTLVAGNPAKFIKKLDSNEFKEN